MEEGFIDEATLGPCYKEELFMGEMGTYFVYKVGINGRLCSA